MSTGRKGEAKFVVYRDIEDGYRWRLRSASGGTLDASTQGHRDKSFCYEEMQSVMAEHPAAGILDVAVG